jgi:hypothetical protein
MWYYTTEGKQMDPVTMKDLQRLVGDGILKPTDMVWKDGMARWIRASSVKELFPEPTSALEQYFTHAKKSDGQANAISFPVGAAAPSAVEPANPRAAAVPAAAVDESASPGQKNRRRSGEDDDRPVPRRRPEPAAGGSSFGIIIALVLGAALLLGALGVGVVILILVAQSSPEGKINPTNLIKGEVKYNLVLNNNTRDTRKFSFRKGVDYEFIVKTTQQRVDVDLYIFHPSGREEASDIGPQADCHVRWTPREDGEYRVDVVNLEHDGPANSTVTIREFKDQLVIDKKGPKDEPLPPDVLEGKGLKEFTISTIKKEDSQKFRVRAGHKVTFKFVPTKVGPKTNFNIIVVKDSDPNQVIEQDVGEGVQASVSFTPKITEIVRVRIINASGKGGGGSAKGFLSYDASPQP